LFTAYHRAINDTADSFHIYTDEELHGYRFDGGFISFSWNLSKNPAYHLYYPNSLPILLDRMTETIVSKIITNKSSLPRLVDSMEDEQ
jgi:hypothetical protein